MDWINCNTCCRQPGDEKGRMFMLSSCGHIFCDLCLAQADSRNKCRVCSTACQLIQLSSKMNPDAEMYFQDPTELIRKQNIQLTRLLEFQKEHRFRLVSFQRKMVARYKEMERQFRMINERIHLLEKENQKLKEIINCGSGKGGGRDSVIMGEDNSLYNSYQRAITASGIKGSPQENSTYHTSPNINRISPGRLTLMKCRPSPSNSPNESRSSKSGSPSHPYVTPCLDSSPRLSGMIPYSAEISRGHSSTLKNVANENYNCNRGMALHHVALPQQMPSYFQTKKMSVPHMQGTHLSQNGNVRNSAHSLREV